MCAVFPSRWLTRLCSRSYTTFIKETYTRAFSIHLLYIYTLTYREEGLKVLLIENGSNLIKLYLYTRNTLCSSREGFHEASKIMTRFAPFKFIPILPALVEVRNNRARGFLGSLNVVLHFRRFSVLVEPSRQK
jgi:hypothetical protein